MATIDAEVHDRDAEIPAFPSAGFSKTEQSDLTTYNPVGGKWYGECHQCCYGGPADTDNPWRWRLNPEQVVRTPTRNGGVNYSLVKNTRCPGCHGSDVGPFIPTGKILEQMKHADLLHKYEELRKHNEALQKALEDKGVAAPIPKPEPKRPPMKGQHAG